MSVGINMSKNISDNTIVLETCACKPGFHPILDMSAGLFHFTCLPIG